MDTPITLQAINNLTDFTCFVNCFRQHKKENGITNKITACSLHTTNLTLPSLIFHCRVAICRLPWNGDICRAIVIDNFDYGLLIYILYSNKNNQLRLSDSCSTKPRLQSLWYESTRTACCMQLSLKYTVGGWHWPSLWQFNLRLSGLRGQQ